MGEKLKQKLHVPVGYIFAIKIIEFTGYNFPFIIPRKVTEMIHSFTQIFGEGKELNTLQMSMRAIVIFMISIALIRLAGLKTFGKNAAFDNIIIITLGAMLSRAIAGVSPFIPVVSASFTLVIIHRIVSWLTIHNHSFATLVKGKPLSLYKDGTINQKNLSKSLLSQLDLEESIRAQTNTAGFQKVQEAILERNGQISVIKKEE